MAGKTVLLVLALIAFKPYLKAIKTGGIEFENDLTKPKESGVLRPEGSGVEGEHSKHERLAEDSTVSWEVMVSQIERVIKDSEVDGVTAYSEVDGVTAYSEVDGVTAYSEVHGVTEYSEVYGATEYSEVYGATEYSEVDKITEYSQIDCSDYSEVNEKTEYSEVDGVTKYSEVEGVDTGVIEDAETKEHQNMSFQDTLFFWESLACGGSSSFCSSGWGSPNLTEPGLLSCTDCLCDDCEIYGDCCLGSSFLRNNSGNERDSLECLSGTEGWNSFTPQSYYFISRCPENYNNVDTIQACEGRHLQVLDAVRRPPVYSPVSRLSYINSHCAKCHEDAQMTETWTPNFICANSRDLQTIKTREDLLRLAEEGSACHLAFSPPSNSVVRKCQRFEPIGECNVTGTWREHDTVLQEACGMYSHVVDFNGAKYRNVFCVLCNEDVKTPEDLDFLDIIYEEVTGDESTSRKSLITTSVVPFSRLFDLTPDEASPPTSGKTECPGNFVFDTFKQECRGLVCSDGRILSNHACVSTLPRAEGVAYNLYFDLAPSRRNSSNDEILQAFQEEIKRWSSSLQPCYQRLGRFRYNTTAHRDTSHVSQWLEYNVLVGSFISQEEAEFQLLDTLKSSWFLHGAPGRSEFYTAHSENNSEKVIRETLYEFKAPGTELCNRYLNETLAITLSKLSRCNQVELEDSETSLNASTGMLTVKAWGRELDVFDYLAVDSKIRVCVNFSGWFHSKNKSGIDETEHWLTLICLAVSVSALLLTFLLSVCSKNRHTLPGLITIMLVITLFLAQSLFLVLALASANKWTCQIIGLLTHYVWLVVFSWKNVAAFHMYVAFTQPFTSRSTNPRRILAKYALFAFGTPAVLVTIYVVAQVVLSNRERFGYTDDCFLAAPVNLGLAFVAPIAIILLINGYFFTRVFHVLKKMSEFEKNSNQSDSAHNSFFIKMSLILGFMWTVGFVSNMLETRVLWYLFDVLNGGVGLLILLTQVFNNQFQYRAKKAFSSREKSTSRTTTEPGGRI